MKKTTKRFFKEFWETMVKGEPEYLISMWIDDLKSSYLNKQIKDSRTLKRNQERLKVKTLQLIK